MKKKDWHRMTKKKSDLTIEWDRISGLVRVKRRIDKDWLISDKSLSTSAKYAISTATVMMKIFRGRMFSNTIIERPLIFFKDQRICYMR